MQLPAIIISHLENRSRFLVVLTVTCSVLFLSALAGLRSFILPPKYVLGAIGALILSLIALRDMTAALTLLVATSATVSFSIATGTQSPVVLAVMLVSLLTGIWVLRMVAYERRVRLVPSELNRPLLSFVLVALVSWLAGYAIWDWWVARPGNALFVQAGQFAMFALSVAACLLTANHEIEERTLKRWTAIIIVLGVSAVIYAVLTSGQRPLTGVTGSMLMWPFVLLFAQLLFNPDLKPWMRLVGWVIVPIWTYWVLTYVLAWKGGWVPALLGFLLLAWFRSKRVLVVLGLALVAFAAINWTQLQPGSYLGERNSGARYRPAIWLDVARLGSRSVLLGLGPANYEYYWDNPQFFSISRQQANWWHTQGYSPPSHNMYVDIFAQTGLIGLALFAWGIVAGVRLGWRLRKQFAPGFTRAYVHGVLCGFIAIAISSAFFADWLLPYVYNITIKGFQHSVYSWLLLGTLVSLEHALKGAHDEQST